MPKILERLVGQLEAKGKPKSNAYAIATSALQKSGNLKKGTQEPTSKGVARGEMTPGERAKDRQASYSGGKPGDYKYNSKSNTATKFNKGGSVRSSEQAFENNIAETAANPTSKVSIASGGSEGHNQSDPKRDMKPGWRRW